MNMKRNFLLLLASILTTSSFDATSKNPDLQILGMGKRSCGQFVKMLNDFDKVSGSVDATQNLMEYVAYNAWSNGYLTAMATDMLVNSGIQIDIPDREARILWLRNYCNDNPLELYSIATISLLLKLKTSK